MYGNMVVTAVTLAIGEKGSKMAYLSHGAWCASLDKAPSASPSIKNCVSHPFEATMCLPLRNICTA